MHALKHKGTPFIRFSGNAITILLAILLWTMASPKSASAQPNIAIEKPDQTEDHPFVLRRSTELQDALSSQIRDFLPLFLTGDEVSGQPDLATTITGNSVLRRGDTVIRSDWMQYDQPSNTARARGNVRINKAGDIYEGTELELKVDSFSGSFNAPRYQLLKNGGYGDAERVDFMDDKNMVIHNGNYTTCRPTDKPGWLPDWILQATTIRLDLDEDVGVAEGAVLRFLNVPLLPIPPISFPLSDKRKSGFLSPTITAADSLNGPGIMQPYYWNIAPNRDATFFPSFMSKRGLNLGTQFRYLENQYQGQAEVNYMASDSLRKDSRWSVNALHQDSFQTPVGNINLFADLNRVSDDNYWRDFTQTKTTLTQRLLPTDFRLNWSQNNFSLGFRSLKWQTLQDINAPITPPYDRLPQLTGYYTRSNFNGFDMQAEFDYTQFDANPVLTNQPNAKRSFTSLQISHPWLAPGWFVTPKAQLHASNYRFDAPLAQTNARSANRILPTFSLDSGLVFERSTDYFGRSFQQTLEPRAYYVYTPLRDQNHLPNYDSGATDFNFATIYTENSFVGNDRISDNNLLTLGVSSRLLDPKTGAQAAQFGIAQRYRFKEQKTTLPGQLPIASGFSDLMLGASVNWTTRWAFDSTVQYDPKLQRSIRSTIGGRYTPSNYRVINAAYRIQRDASEQIDLGWQWPINDLWGDKGQDLGAGRGTGGNRWYTVGRLNYSMQDRKLVDTIVGFEYDSCCWIGRVVLERLQSGVATSSSRLLFQLEFVGFSRVGSDPLRTLKQNIPRYQYLREDNVNSPLGRFSNYN